jgi:hypothetical protein
VGGEVYILAAVLFSHLSAIGSVILFFFIVLVLVLTELEELCVLFLKYWTPVGSKLTIH